jgi:hypothetical protein
MTLANRARRHRRASLHKAALVLVVLSCTMSCAVGVEGTFGDLGFSPQATAVAILDENDLLWRNGAVLPVARPRAQKKIHVWMTSEAVDPFVDWRFLSGSLLADLRTRLALSDLLVVEGLDYDALGDGKILRAHDDDGRSSGDFSFSLSHRALHQDAPTLETSGLGARVSVAAAAERVEDGDPRGGHLRVTFVVSRERAAGQPPGDLVTGEVTLTLDTTFAPERLAEANLALVAPIAACGARGGPLSSGECADEPARPIVDGSGLP